MSVKKKGKKVLAAALTASSIAVNTSVANAQDIINPENILKQPEVQNEVEDEIYEKTTLSEKLRNALISMPFLLRTAIGVPLWFLGYILLFLAEGAWNLVLSPLFSNLLSFLLFLVIVLIGITITGKAMFPNVPVKKILNKKTVGWVFITSVILYGFNLAGPYLFDDYDKYRRIAQLVGSAVIMVLGIFLVYKGHTRKQFLVSDDSLTVEA